VSTDRHSPNIQTIANYRLGHTLEQMAVVFDGPDAVPSTHDTVIRSKSIVSEKNVYVSTHEESV
jgi:hypothetical protein